MQVSGLFKVTSDVNSVLFGVRVYTGQWCVACVVYTMTSDINFVVLGIDEFFPEPDGPT